MEVQEKGQFGPQTIPEATSHTKQGLPAAGSCQSLHCSCSLPPRLTHPPTRPPTSPSSPLTGLTSWGAVVQGPCPGPALLPDFSPRFLHGPLDGCFIALLAGRAREGKSGFKILHRTWEKEPSLSWDKPFLPQEFSLTHCR